MSAAPTTYWNSLAGATKTAEVEKLLLYASLGIFGFDTILNAGFDYSILSGKRQRRWAQLLYFGTKLAFVVYLSLYIAVFWLEKKMNCKAMVIAVETSMGFIAAMSSALLACRTVCVFFGTARKVVTFLLLVFGAGLMAAWMYGVQDVTVVWSAAAASPWNAGACAPVSVKPTYYVKYVLTIIFDLLVLILTTIGILRMNSSSRIGDIIIKQGILYFILTLLANLVITVLTILQLSPTMSLLAAAPQSCVCVVVSTRLYRELAEEASPKPHISSSARMSPSYKSGGSSNHSLPTTSSQNNNNKFGSSDFMEKGGITSNVPTSPTSIHIHQTVDTFQTPDYLRGHPFSNSTLVDQQDHQSNDSPVHGSYPRLFGKGQVKRSSA